MILFYRSLAQRGANGVAPSCLSAGSSSPRQECAVRRSSTALSTVASVAKRAPEQQSDRVARGLQHIHASQRHDHLLADLLPSRRLLTICRYAPPPEVFLRKTSTTPCGEHGFAEDTLSIKPKLPKTWRYVYWFGKHIYNAFAVTFNTHISYDCWVLALSDNKASAS
jgi:hypothetical protein